MEYTNDPRDLSKPYNYRVPKVDMYAPIPDELLENLPPWVKTLQKVAYWLMFPFFLVFTIGFLGEALGFWP